MRKDVLTGKITSINHEKNYVSVAYLYNERKRTITCRMDEREAETGEKREKRKHTYRVGDEVSFQVKGVDRGAKMIAYNLKFLYNNELQKLLDQAAINNRFTGYLKMADDTFFIKERDSYIFFPLELSKWEIPPSEESFNEPVEFRLLHTDKLGRISAELFTHNYISEFRKVVQLFKHQTPTDAVVTRVSPYAAYINIMGEQIQSKILLKGDSTTVLKEGDKVQVRITHLSNSRIVTELI